MLASCGGGSGRSSGGFEGEIWVSIRAGSGVVVFFGSLVLVVKTEKASVRRWFLGHEHLIEDVDYETNAYKEKI